MGVRKLEQLELKTQSKQFQPRLRSGSVPIFRRVPCWSSEKIGQLDYNCPTFLGTRQGFYPKTHFMRHCKHNSPKGENQVSSDAVGVNSIRGYSHKCRSQFLSKPIQIQSQQEGSNFFSTIISDQSEAKNQNYAQSIGCREGI